MWRFKRSYNYVEVAPYWNVNLNLQQTYLSLQQVEVAPYWNVNSNKLNKKESANTVEVAPYWNVNIQSIHHTPYQYSQKQLHIGM